MIHVPKAQADQVQFLLEQSMKGIHLLFEPDFLRRALQFTPLSEAEAYSVEPHLERLMALPSLELQQLYLRELRQDDPAALCKLIQTYFSIIENTLLETSEVRH
jgi:hypothetical protein